ncbi:MAG: alpha-ketoacid dehydrogenase subunit beta [Candidatus Limnocylindrales bacterium]
MSEASHSELRVIDAIRSALDTELSRDPRVCIFGEDVTVGGPFGATNGLAEAYGVDRVVNTPISEATVMGLAIGAALAGRRPVVEIMFIDFITLAMDQLVNHAAKLRYMSGGQLSVPLTIRAQGGATGAMGAQHSQSLEAWFMAVPGIKVVAPSTAADAKGLLTAAIRDDDPVLFLEHRGLYWSKGEVPDGEYSLPLGEAVVRRPGRDATVVAWSAMVAKAIQAAEDLAGAGIEVEVIDLRSLVPLDLETIVASVRRTGRLVVAHEAVEQGGPGGEILAAVSTAAGAALTAPGVRVGAPSTPVPAAADLEALFVPSAEKIAAAVRRVMGRS